MNEFETALHIRLEAMETAIKADRAALHTKFDAVLQGIHHLLSTGSTDMSALTDALKASVSTIASVAADNAAKTTTLIGYKDEDTSALTTMTATLSTASDSLKATGAALDAAITAHTAGSGGSSDTPSSTVTVAAPTIAPATIIPVAPADASSIATAVAAGTTDGSTVVISGPGISTAAPVTVTAADPVAGTITLDTPTVADHSGDGSETLTVSGTPAS